MYWRMDLLIDASDAKSVSPHEAAEVDNIIEASFMHYVQLKLQFQLLVLCV